jgi:HSP20 family protein
MLERWNPVAEAERMLTEMNRLMSEVFERPLVRARLVAWRPATDVYETGDALVIRLAVPGARPEDLEVTVEQNVVTIRGQYGLPAGRGGSEASDLVPAGDCER